MIIAGHAFVQNVRRGHYELEVEVSANRRVAVAFDELALAISLADASLSSCRAPTRRNNAEHRAGIQASLLYGLSNGLVESVNTKLRLLIRIAFGFHSPDALIRLAMLALGGLCPPLPGRA